jgi:hypothetical protein
MALALVLLVWKNEMCLPENLCCLFLSFAPTSLSLSLLKDNSLISPNTLSLSCDSRSAASKTAGTSNATVGEIKLS